MGKMMGGLRRGGGGWERMAEKKGEGGRDMNVEDRTVPLYSPSIM